MVEGFLQDAPQLHPFRAFPPKEDGYEEAIASKDLGKEERELLADSLLEQYKKDDVSLSPRTKENIETLRDPSSFTVTTGHQLCLFTGPLLTVHKILHTIRLAEELQERYPQNRIVPVHWMASEDHDREEIDHVHVNGTPIRWESSQEGPVGRMRPEGVEPLIEALQPHLEELDFGEEWSELLRSSYLKAESWAQATRKLLNGLFGQKGLLILDGDDPSLKTKFREDLKKEFTEKRSAKSVERTNGQLQEQGYDLQVQHRPINLFYMEDGYRERIEEMNGGFRTVDGKFSWEQNEALQEIEEHPERFSPNVILRPLYQERILPNVGYVGGPAEVAYWHQLKGLFDDADAFFPVLQLRSQLFHIDRKSCELMETTGLRAEDLFKERSEVIRERVKAQSDKDLELEEEKKQLGGLFDRLADKASQIDPNLEDPVLAERRKAEKSLEKVQKKMIRHAKKHEGTLVDRIERVFDHLYPEGAPQERKENLTLFYAQEGTGFLERISKQLNPFHAEAIMIVEKEG